MERAASNIRGGCLTGAGMVAILLLSACVAPSSYGDRYAGGPGTVGAARQEQVCANEYARRLGVPVEALRTSFREPAPNGINSVVGLRTAQGRGRALCQVDPYGHIVAFDRE